MNNQEDNVVGGEDLKLTGLDAIERYKSIVGDLYPDIWEQYKDEKSTVAWRVLALNMISKAKHERDKLRTELERVKVERDENERLFNEVLKERTDFAIQIYKLNEKMIETDINKRWEQGTDH